MRGTLIRPVYITTHTCCRISLSELKVKAVVVIAHVIVQMTRDCAAIGPPVIAKISDFFILLQFIVSELDNTCRSSGFVSIFAIMTLPGLACGILECDLKVTCIQLVLVRSNMEDSPSVFGPLTKISWH